MRGENDNPEGRDAPVFIASWKALALPMLVVAVGYGVLSVWLGFAGRSDGALARLCHIILALGVPFLAAGAMLRMATIKVQPRKRAAFLQVGFPHNGVVDVPYALISDISIRYGMTGRFMSSGTLIFRLIDGGKVAVADLARPEMVREYILRRMDAVGSLSPALEPARESEPATATTLG